MQDALELFLVMVAVASPAFIIVFIVYYFRYKAEMNRQLARLSQQIEVRAHENLQDEVAQLEERLQVLEAIVTDGKYELLQEFRAMQRQNP